MRVAFAMLHCLPLVAADAQRRSFDVATAAGVAIPTGVRRDYPASPGPLVRLGVETRSHDSGLRFRLDAEMLTFSFRAPSSASQLHRYRHSAASLNYSALAGPTGQRFAPYALAGVGLRGEGSNLEDSWPGVAITMRFGAGVRWHTSRVVISAAVAPVGSIRYFGSNSYWPITLGVAF